MTIPLIACRRNYIGTDACELDRYYLDGTCSRWPRLFCVRDICGAAGSSPAAQPITPCAYVVTGGSSSQGIQIAGHQVIRLLQRRRLVFGDLDPEYLHIGRCLG
jgi:hypothetical protein